MQRLEQLEAEAIYIIREAYHFTKPCAVLWSMGKDSNVLLWLIKKAFLGNVPFKVILLDTEEELPEVYEFRDKYVQEWNLDYINATCPSIAVTNPNLPPNARAAERKSLGLQQVISEYNFRGIMLGIRRDEQAIRAKERFFSPRNPDGTWLVDQQPIELWDFYNTTIHNNQHLRIHPLLSWTELDIWLYIKEEQIPIVPLYFARNGMRYRSLGEKNITKPVPSNASTVDEIIAELENTRTAERSGRAMDNETEDAFEKLRASGYM